MPARLIIGLLLTLFAAGCGNRTLYPVRGQIVDKAGAPVTGLKGYTVEFDNIDFKISANGVVDETGNFRLSASSPNDGAHHGQHRVAILRPDSSTDMRVPFVIHPKYEKFETSGLTATVEKRDNVVKLEVELFKR